MGQGGDAIIRVDRWMGAKVSVLAPEKTEALIIHRGHRFVRDVTFHQGRVEMQPRRFINYLGVWQDDNMSFTEHFRRTSEKAGKCHAALGRSSQT